jgi:metallo-beta-lactamase family protein
MPIKLEFLGAAQGVTGSSYSLDTGSLNLLIDCGMHQERQFKYRDWEPFPISPNKLDAVLLTHAHIDHSGLLPKLVKEGFRGPIYCTAATAEITEIMLLDSARIQEEDAEYKKKRHRREGRSGRYPEIPLYTVEDAEMTNKLLSPLRYREVLKFGNGVEASFHDAGHVLGSAMIRLDIESNSEKRTIIFSGDIGRHNKPILRNPTHFNEADYIVMESTYGTRLHEPPEDMSRELAEVVNATVKSKGNIAIPTFALERAQEVLYYLNSLLVNKHIPGLMVFLDSPMAVRVTDVFKDFPELFDKEMVRFLRQGNSPFDFPGLHLVRSVDQSKAINHISGSVIIMAGSGMCTGGRIKHHLVNNISKVRNTILFVGYQAMGTLGRQIVDGAKRVRIMGKRYPVKARVVQLNGFSAHADRDELLEWLSSFTKPPRRLFVTHGESDASASFAELVKQQKGWDVVIPEYRQIEFLD